MDNYGALINIKKAEQQKAEENIITKNIPQFVIIEWLNRESKPKIIFIGYLLVLALLIIDHITWPSLSFLIFYLIPISLVTWFVSRSAGLFMSFVCAVALFIHDMLMLKMHAYPVVPLWNIMVSACFFLFAVYTLSSLKLVLTKQTELANIDYLTRIANRKFFSEMAHYEMGKALRYHHQVSIAYVDIDDLKKVNDEFGHHAGDTVLKTVAETIRENIRDIDIAARIGGDEFVIFLPETDYKNTDRVIQRIKKKLSDAAQNKNLPINTSIGVITCAYPFLCPLEDIIKAADTLMYKAKKEGKAQIKHEVWEKSNEEVKNVRV